MDIADTNGSGIRPNNGDIKMQTIDDIELVQAWCTPLNEALFIAALTEGGDSRLLIGSTTGMNKYLVPPTPVLGQVCFSSCTASPVSNEGYRLAMRCYFDMETAQTSDDRAERRAAWQAKVNDKLSRYLDVDGLADILLLPSGTDGLLLCSILLSLESSGKPVTAIVPEASETGTGVPRAAMRQPFDGPILTGQLAKAVTIPLRTPDGDVRPDDAINEDFALAARKSPGRPVIYMTYGTKTGLVAPLAVPPGIDVVVDACQLRLSPSVIKVCLRKGWPVVVTGSKYLGGPPFSGAVLLPRDRFVGIRERALAEWSQIVSAAGETQTSEGTLLRWVAAIAGLDIVRPLSTDLRNNRTNIATCALKRVPGVMIVDGPTWPMTEAAAAPPEIITFAIAHPSEPSTLLTSSQLRTIHAAMADRGVLLGQPVDVGSFGALRLAFGLRNHQTDQLKTDLDSVTDLLSSCSVHFKR